MNYKYVTAISAAILTASIANAEWKYGVATGFGLSSYDGDVELGGVKYDVDFDNSDVEQGFGLGAFATNGTWVFNLSGSSVEYESKDSPKGGGTRTKNNFELKTVELTAGYVVYREDDITLTPYAGIKYTDHDWDFKGSGLSGGDDDWTDAVVGLKLDYKISEEWTWNNSAEYSFGDSEGCYALETGVSWQFAEHWVTGAHLGYNSDEFEGSKGYKYDADVTSLKLSIAYVW